MLDLLNNALTGEIPPACGAHGAAAAEPVHERLHGSTYLPRNTVIGRNRLGGAIPNSIGLLGQVVKIDFSGNELSGPIPPEIGHCVHLTFLDLSQNNLSGPIPAEIAEIGILNYLNLSRNHLTQCIPRSIGGMRSLTVATSPFAGNPQLCGPVLNSPCNYSTGPARLRRVPGEFKLVLALGLLVCSLIFAAAAAVRSYKRGGSDSSGSGAWRLSTFQKVNFGVSDVLECMKEGNVVGRGGAGVVYAGRTQSGGTIAVKRLLGLGSGGGGGEHDHGFAAEVRTLGSIRPRNRAAPGFCTNQSERAGVRVHEQRSLGELLHGKGGGFLGWERRYRIAVEAARGLCYLHHDCSPMIVHRDVKSNNILLGDNFEAHVADFGLAKFLRDGGASECMSAVAGSYGYIAPGALSTSLYISLSLFSG
ncbi:Leucine-rich repeat receptor-like serine/threonine-protein kinase BAM2 [Ananas comosus]|uniref:Leucine-rich repeat receptor-like serine/threonine-protein kinase BAM2 n=1 Tax=Ananas comosus TaxID=4615 RepID=A0A199UYM1_ANACO|nr:Leucine-rich repeat receptor-like serine/threonine-protein kinase BAM2 [Ananas comosus]